MCHAKVCDSMEMFAKVYRSMRMLGKYAKVCKSVQVSEIVCYFKLKYAKVFKSMQNHR